MDDAHPTLAQRIDKIEQQCEKAFNNHERQLSELRSHINNAENERHGAKREGDKCAEPEMSPPKGDYEQFMWEGNELGKTRDNVEVLGGMLDRVKNELAPRIDAVEKRLAELEKIAGLRVGIMDFEPSNTYHGGDPYDAPSPSGPSANQMIAALDNPNTFSGVKRDCDSVQSLIRKFVIPNSDRLVREAQVLLDGGEKLANLFIAVDQATGVQTVKVKAPDGVPCGHAAKGTCPQCTPAVNIEQLRAVARDDARSKIGDWNKPKSSAEIAVELADMVLGKWWKFPLEWHEQLTKYRSAMLAEKPSMFSEEATPSAPPAK